MVKPARVGQLGTNVFGSSEPTMGGFHNLVAVGIGPVSKNWLLSTKYALLGKKVTYFQINFLN